MPTEEEKESLQDLLRELLATNPPEAVAPTAEQGAEAEPGGETKGEEGAQAVSSEQQPIEDVSVLETVRLEADPSSALGEEVTTEAEGSQAAAQPQTLADSILVDGTVEVKLASKVSADRLALFERALKGREGVLWLGTWGRPKQGVTLRLRLEAPMTPSDLLEGMAVLERLEPAKAGQGWLLQVNLATQDSAEAPSAPEAPPAPATPEAPPPAQVAPPPVLSQASVEVAALQVDLEITPIASLEALNRLEKLLSSFSPTCRVVNVLSLDGVSTVLVTLEGIDGGTLARKLQESVGAVQMEVKPDRLVAQLPAKW